MSEFVTTSESKTVTAHGIFNNNKLDDDVECNISIYTDGCKEFVEESGGFEEFDYET